MKSTVEEVHTIDRLQEMAAQIMNGFDPFFGQGIDVGLEEDENDEESDEENENHEENVEPILVDEGNMINDVEVDMANLEDSNSESNSDSNQ
ncbi:hypothetical protein L6452_32182 [Arctium lappa]|uniref:Uncharacterized protein n=1 Tax=Arctium lappa TaxID=4217 RepID=A0ACB8Z441_ARCLA|nr:hypothetical protein L6452_32182 [Arctium lappa]